jgi:hypothetical protein
MANDYHKLCEEFDGFFVFFEECWRIMKPDALIHIRAPFGVSYASLCDPTHTRYLTPGSFGYLAGQDEDAPFDYNIQCRYEVVLPVHYRFQGNWNYQMSLRNEKGIEELLKSEPGVADEFRITLRALKE